MYNVLIAGEQALSRNLFEIYINSSRNFRHLSSIADISGALSICRTGSVDLILMDVMTKTGHSGLDAAEEIKKQIPGVKILVVTSIPEYSWPDRAKAIGVDSFWYKDDQKRDLLEVMERTMAGEQIYPDEIPVVPIGNASNHDFTKRELEILKELITGDSNSVIAGRLEISAGTVKNHVQHMLKKTGFKTRTELAAEARILGIVIKESQEDEELPSGSADE